MSTPLYDCLRGLAGERPLRFDMPGHHGKALPGWAELGAALDVTENGRSGDLLGGSGDVIARAEQLWAQRLGFDSCLFLTGGSTQGIHTGLALLAGAEGSVALDRASHRSAYHAMALLGLRPHYLGRRWRAAEGVLGPVEPEELDRLLSAHPEVKTACITSPTYYGVLSDIPALAAVCRRHGARLMVDGAHGAHLPWLGDADARAADVVVMSTHKTLPAPGQTALLLANGMGLAELQRMGAVYGSSSPSYLMMGALDVLRDYMERMGHAEYRRVAERTAGLRRTLPALTEQGGLRLDPTRLVVRCRDGLDTAHRLRERGIYPEMADVSHLVFILTCADSDGELEQLAAVLGGLPPPEGGRPHPAPPPLPRQILSPRQALFAPREQVPLEQSVGRVCAGQIAPYPPGIPVLAPGEQVDKKHLVYLEQMGYNGMVADVVKESAAKERVP